MTTDPFFINVSQDCSPSLRSLAAMEGMPGYNARWAMFLDDWGLEPLNEQARHDLLEILEDRYGRRSTIITSQLPVSAWHGIIGDPTYADAILDRLVHNAHRIELSGESLRRNLPRKA